MASTSSTSTTVAPQNYSQNSATMLARTGGSGFTVFGYMGNPLAWGQIVQHQSPTLVGQGSSAIQPLDSPYPLQIMTAAAAGVGTITFSMYDLWGKGSSYKIWDSLGRSQGHPYQNASDIVDLVILQAQQDPSKLQITEWIRPIPAAMTTYPLGHVSAANATTETKNSSPAASLPLAYGIRYHGATIVAVADGTSVQVSTLEVIKQITFNYTYTTRLDRQGAANTSGNGVKGTNVARSLFT